MNNNPQLTDSFEEYTDTPNLGLDYDAEARKITWDEANRRLAEAAALIPQLEEQGKITKQARDVLAQAEANESVTREKYNGLHGTGKAMKESIIKLCSIEGVAIPQDGPPAGADVGHTGMYPMPEPVAERSLGGES